MKKKRKKAERLDSVEAVKRMLNNELSDIGVSFSKNEAGLERRLKSACDEARIEYYRKHGRYPEDDNVFIEIKL